MKNIADWMDKLGTSVSELERMVGNSSIENLDIELEDLLLFNLFFLTQKVVFLLPEDYLVCRYGIEVALGAMRTTLHNQPDSCTKNK